MSKAAGMFTKAAGKDCCVPCDEGFVVCAAFANTKRQSITASQVDWYLDIVRNNDLHVNFSNIPKLKASVLEEYFNSKDESPSPLGMHLVRYNAVLSAKIEMKPLYSNEEVLRYRDCMACDCMTFHQTAWVCKHVLIARYKLFLVDCEDGYNLMTAGSNIRVVNRPGRPTKSVNCLKNTTVQDEKYWYNAVVQKPERLLGFRVVRKAKVNDVLVQYSGRVCGLCPKTNSKHEYTYHVEMDNGVNEFWTTSEIWKGKLE